TAHSVARALVMGVARFSGYTAAGSARYRRSPSRSAERIPALPSAASHPHRHQRRLAPDALDLSIDFAGLDPGLGDEQLLEQADGGAGGHPRDEVAGGRGPDFGRDWPR